MLKISNLSKTYDNGTKALDNINLEISKGLFGLLGPNGAGKSTLMRTLATLQEPDNGSIEFDGHAIFEQPQMHRQNLGYLPQDFGVYPDCTAEFLLGHLASLKGIYPKKSRRQTIEALLEKVNLYANRKQKMNTFSGGMLRRFGVAQALLGNPQLLMVDEPAAGLDPEERDRILNLLAEIAENRTVILSTHFVDNVRDLCSQMAVLNKGRIVQVGNRESFIAPLKGMVWKQMVPKEKIPGLKNQFMVLSTRLRLGRFAVRIYSPTKPSEGFEVTEPRLEDAYFLAVKEEGLEICTST